MNDAASHVFDVGEANFTNEVVEASQTVPILVDFWAEWCAPCKELGPLLESLAERSRGGFRLAKVDTEKEQRLAAAFQVQSIPFVVAFKGGKPVDAFVGLKTEAELIELLTTKLGVQFDATPDEEAESAAPSAYTRALTALRQADVEAFDEVAPELEALEEDDDDFTVAERILAAVDWIRGPIAGEGPAAEALRVAREDWLAGHWNSAMEGLLESVSEERDLGEQMARRALVLLMQCHDEDKEILAQLRRRLALLLY